jgi:prepilin-type N-terminal cleavage/methylation domain-containing protein
MKTNRKSRGFTLIEVMVVLLITTILGALLFSQINLVQQRATNEDQKLDLFQESRDFMDQMTRDLHQAGYPNLHNFSPGQLQSTMPNSPSAGCSPLLDPTACSSSVAVGLVKIDNGQLWFEGDVDGTGTVSEVVYQLVSTGVNCPCLRRSQIAKVYGNPFSEQGTPQYYTEIQGVQNGTSTNPIFYAFRTDNSSVTLPVDFNNNSTDIASVNEIKVVITAQSPYVDPKTGVKPSVTMVSTVKLNNCSQAASGQTFSCQ